MLFTIDEVAKEFSKRQWRIPDSLLIPVAAVDEAAIQKYVGDVERVLSRGSPPKALLVVARDRPPVDPLLPISKHPNVAILHARQQVWVHIAFKSYRRAYCRAFSQEHISNMVLSHSMNRRTAALKGFQYVRLTPVSRGANSSSAFSEEWAVALHDSPRAHEIRKISPPYVQYGDIVDVMLMLDMQPGGGVMDAINDGQRLFEPGVIDA